MITEIKSVKPENEAEKKQARAFKAREEEREIERKVNQSLEDMEDRQKDLLIANFIAKMPHKDTEFKKALAELELRAFVFERILFANKDVYPNLYREYREYDTKPYLRLINEL